MAVNLSTFINQILHQFRVSKFVKLGASRKRPVQTKVINFKNPEITFFKSVHSYCIKDLNSCNSSSYIQLDFCTSLDMKKRPMLLWLADTEVRVRAVPVLSP